MDLPDAVEAIKFRMEQSGLTVKDLQPVITALTSALNIRATMVGGEDGPGVGKIQLNSAQARR